LRDQWNTHVPWVPSTPILKKVHDFTLHPKPIIPIFSEIFFKLPTYPGNWETFGTFYIEIMTDKEIAARLQNILL